MASAAAAWMVECTQVVTTIQAVAVLVVQAVTPAVAWVVWVAECLAGNKVA